MQPTSDMLPGVPELLVIGLIISVIVFLGLWLWSLIHCITNKRLSDSNRLIGIVLIVILGLIGSVVYLFLPREQPPGIGGIA
ncbi:MAG: PLDc N-terminal domain-containing protein [Luteolibacter sp.]